MVLYEIEHFNIYHERESEKTLEDINTVLHEAYDDIIAHEYIHIIIYRMNEHCNLWINEGMALF